MRDRNLPRKPLRRAFWLIALAGILSIAAGLRAVGINWDEGRHLHPDERFLCQVESAIDPARSLREYLDTDRSPLNPNNRGFGFFVYGTLPLMAVQALGTWFAAPANDLDRSLFGVDLGPEYGAVHLIGRALSAGCDLLTTLLVFAIGATLYGRGVGLLASALYAGAVLPIQQAHFFTVDAMATLCTTLAMWFAARAATRAHWSDDVLFGVALGAGLACKASIFPVVALMGISVVLRFAAHGDAMRAKAAVSHPAHPRRSAALAVRALLSLNVVVIAALLSFRLLQPYAFVPPYPYTPSASPSVRAFETLFNIAAPRFNPAWLEQMDKARRQQQGDDDSPPNHQWATRPPLFFAWFNLVAFGLGWPLGVVAWIGWAWALYEGLRGRAESWRHVLPVSWIGLYFAWTGAGWVTTMRYFLPIYPALAVTAAWVLVRAAAPDLDASRPGHTAPPRWRRALGGTAIAAVLIATLAWAWAFTRIYTQPHTRIAASRWIYANLPSAVTALIETDAGVHEEAISIPTARTVSSNAPSAPLPHLPVAAPGMPATARFRPAQPGRLIGLRLHTLRVRDLPPAPIARWVTAAVSGGDLAAEARCALPPALDRGVVEAHAVECRFDPTPLDAERDYELRIEASEALELAGTALADEGSWDDALPVPLPGLDPDGRYATLALEMVWEDDETKRRRLQHVLDRSDYLVISSNRFYGSLPRNPRRWPMSLDYYRALFSGELGFALAADFAAPPALGPLRIDDQHAEEAFTVYDHPRVLIFRKTEGYDPARSAAILARADLGRVVRRRAAEVGDPPTALELPAAVARRE